MQNDSPAATATSTSTNRTWLIKFVIFFVVSAGLGAWFWVDGLIVYPERGKDSARFTLLQYLDVLEDERRLTAANAAVTDPAETLAELSNNEPESQIEILRRNWLRALSRVKTLDQVVQAEDVEGSDDPDSSHYYLYTNITNPRGALADLERVFENRGEPAALAAYDIPLQLILGVVCTIAAIFVALRIVQTASVTFHYDHASHTITGPKGLTASPDNVAVVDKRKWDKFFVFLKLDDGSEHKLDLYRFTPLEDWVLDLEKLTRSFEPEPGPDGQITAADVRTGVVSTRTVDGFDPDAEQPIVIKDGETPAIYPAQQDLRGTWYVVGGREREALKAAISSGTLPATGLRVNPDTFELDVTRVDTAPTETETPNADAASEEQTAQPQPGTP